MESELIRERKIGELARRVRLLESALAESVKLQSHYAMLLNAYDGGKRLQFTGPTAWMARLEELNHLPTSAPNAGAAPRAGSGPPPERR